MQNSTNMRILELLRFLYAAVSNRIMKRFTTSLTISKQRLETISKFGSNTMNILKKKRKS